MAQWVALKGPGRLFQSTLSLITITSCLDCHCLVDTLGRGLAKGNVVAKSTGKGRVVKRPGVLSKDEIGQLRNFSIPWVRGSRASKGGAGPDRAVTVQNLEDGHSSAGLEPPLDAHHS